MKKALLVLAAIALFTACNKESEVQDKAPVETQSIDSQVKICFDVASPGDYHLFFSYPSHWFVVIKIN